MSNIPQILIAFLSGVNYALYKYGIYEWTPLLIIQIVIIIFGMLLVLSGVFEKK